MTWEGVTRCTCLPHPTPPPSINQWEVKPSFPSFPYIIGTSSVLGSCNCSSEEQAYRGMGGSQPQGEPPFCPRSPGRASLRMWFGAPSLPPTHMHTLTHFTTRNCNVTRFLVCLDFICSSASISEGAEQGIMRTTVPSSWLSGTKAPRGCLSC